MNTPVIFIVPCKHVLQLISVVLCACSVYVILYLVVLFHFAAFLAMLVAPLGLDPDWSYWWFSDFSPCTTMRWTFVFFS